MSGRQLESTDELFLAMKDVCKSSTGPNSAAYMPSSRPGGLIHKRLGDDASDAYGCPTTSPTRRSSGASALSVSNGPAEREHPEQPARLRM